MPRTLMLSEALATMNRTMAISRSFSRLINISYTILAGLGGVYLWSFLRPSQGYEQLFVGILAMTSVVVHLVRKRTHNSGPSTISAEDLVLALEIQNPETATPASTLLEHDEGRSYRHVTPKAEDGDKWESILRAHVEKLQNQETGQRRNQFLRILAPTAAIVALAFYSPGSIRFTVLSALSPVIGSQATATLEVLDGLIADSPGEASTESRKLSADQPTELKLHGKNLLRLTLKAPLAANMPNGPRASNRSLAPSITLKPIDTDDTRSGKSNNDKSKNGKSNATFQSFQLAREDSGRSPTGVQTYTISFSVDHPVRLYIDSISLDRHVAAFDVQVIPRPEVTLELTSAPKDPWPDDQPLPLRIVGRSKQPLAKIELIIRGAKRESRELVRDVLAKDRKRLSVDYSLLLEPFLNQDIEELEIIAEATDRSIPVPRRGQSNPLKLTVASAYGRYRQTLETMREIRRALDRAKIDQKPKVGEEVADLADQTEKQAQNSPFFDALDRVFIRTLKKSIAENQKSPSLGKVYRMSSELSKFLFDHEIIDDRERDRDFFVAARALSRLIETSKDDRPLTVEMASDRLLDFLEDRSKRWKARVDRLKVAKRPEAWGWIQSERPFRTAIGKISELSKNPGLDAVTESIGTLSKTVEEYRSWINALEKAEDESRETQERERQQGLASARNELREIQKMQGKVSTALDKAASADQQQLKDSWVPLRMKQKSNANRTGRLENQLRSLSPEASRRIEAAKSAMEGVVREGNGDRFVRAESFSDLAGRLLRQADSAAQKSQKRSGGRSRRRRVSGDNYYGRSVVGGDVEIRRDYQVDRRYREDILDEIYEADVNEEERALLNRYLRRIVR